jgi:hypothetical protein
MKKRRNLRMSLPSLRMAKGTPNRTLPQETKNARKAPSEEPPFSQITPYEL